jgi:hypothetical protein
VKAVARDAAETRPGLLDRIQRAIHNVTSGSLTR